MKRYRLHIAFLTAAALVAGCSTTKRLGQEEVLYTGVRKITIEADSGVHMPSYVESAVKNPLSVKPNNPLYSPYIRTPLPVGLWAYNYLHTEKTKGFKHWLYERLAKDPVLVSSVQPELRVQMVSDILANYGYFGSRASDSLLHRKHGRKAKKAKKPKKKKSLGRRLLILFLVLAILAGLYLTAVYSDIPFIAKWRTAYIQTAMNTLSHQWLATAFIPRSVIDKVLAEMEAAREAQIGINSEWDEGESESRNPTLTNTEGMSKEEIAFYNLFWEVNVPSMQAYVKEHPDALAAGWSRINIDKSALTADGTSIRTIQGEQVLAIDARNKILIARVKGSTYRGVLVIMKDPSRLSLQAASTLGSVGQVCGKIAEAHGGVIGMTGSGFIDPGGTGNGGTLAGYAMCNGKSYGSHMGYGYKRLELHKDNRIYIRDSDSSVSPDTTDAVEFSPAMIIDGETVVNARSGFSDLQPRACLGQSKYGEIIALLVEGRLTTSVGISVPDCAAIMTKHDCMQAMNLDGGTSAMIWYKGKYIMRSSNPALTAGRTLPNAFVYTGN